MEQYNIIIYYKTRVYTVMYVTLLNKLKLNSLNKKHAGNCPK